LVFQKNGKTWFTFGFMAIHILGRSSVLHKGRSLRSNYVDFGEIVQFIFTTGKNVGLNILKARFNTNILKAVSTTNFFKNEIKVN